MLYFAGILGFMLAFAIGANDVANSMATAVGAKALSMKKALFIAAILEFLGAVLFGSIVTQTISKGIIKLDFINDSNILMLGAITTLISTTVWILISTFWGMPISTTHSIVSGMLGFGIVAGGLNAVNWISVLTIVSAWFISPILGGILTFTIYKLIKYLILHSEHPRKASKRYVPFFITFTVFIITFLLSLKTIKLNIQYSFLWQIGLSVLFFIFSKLALRKYNHSVEHIFSKMQIMTSCYMQFSHGSNDAANAIAPLALILTVINGGLITSQLSIPIWVLMLGGLGIGIGGLMFGKNVIKTMGNSITELNNVRAFSVDFGGATTVLLSSIFGLPVSTTHIAVGSVQSIGLENKQINFKLLRTIFCTWILTVPIVAFFSGLLFLILSKF